VDLENGRAFEIRAAVTVNATGPWVQEVLQEGGLPVPKQIVPSKGIHILLERSRLPLTAATFLRSSTGRRGLAMPRGPWVYVGTSATEYWEDLDDPLAQAAEIAELLEMTRDCFPEAKLETKDVKGFWAGIRPLIFEKGKSTRDTSRHDEVWISPPGLVTVAGGKLTTYRPMAHRILEGVAETLGRVLPGVERSAEVPLPGAPSEPISTYRLKMHETLTRRGLAPDTVERLQFLYGTELEELLAYGDEEPGWLEPLSLSLPALRGEVRLAVEHGMALHLADVLDRRMALLLFSGDGGVSGLVEAASIMGKLLGWTEEHRKAEMEEYLVILRGHRPFVDTAPTLG
jgi:glycerol-3-phosphate dehydrogenase